jgi:hypothetical protein
VKYSVHEFTAQGVGLRDTARPFTNVSAQIVWLLNDESFCLTRYLVSQLATTMRAVKKNVQEVMGFHIFSLKLAPNVLSADQKAARVVILHELENNLLSERRHNFSLSSEEHGTASRRPGRVHQG